MTTFLPILAQVVLTALGALTALAAIRTARTPQGAVGWVVFLVSFPLVALPAFALFGRIGFRGYARRRREADRDAVERAPDPRPDPTPARLDALAGIADAPLVPGNTLQLLIDGAETFPALFEALDGAREEALVQFYIVRDDEIGRALQRRMIAAAGRGVRVRFLYDALGCLLLPRRYVRELREAGVEAHAIRGPVRPIGRLGLNFRNHRKTVIVDGRTGFTGGINAAQEYLDGGRHFASWRDTFLRMEGPMVSQLRAIYAQDWAWTSGRPLEQSPATPTEALGGLSGLVLGCGPTDPIERCSLFLCGLIGLARERLWIATPYLVPHTDLLTALQLAAMRGVSVRVLLPAPADHLLPWYASRDYFDDLQHVGVEIWEYQAGFMHSKIVLVDDDIASVGTINIDIRSVMLNFEATAAVEDRGFAREVEAILKADFARAAVAPSGHPRSSVRLLAPVARLAAPLL